MQLIMRKKMPFEKGHDKSRKSGEKKKRTKPLTSRDYEVIKAFHANGGVKQTAYKSVYEQPKSVNDANFNARASAFFDRPTVIEAMTKIEAKALEECEINATWVLAKTKKVIERCMQEEQVLDRNGNPVMVMTDKGKLAAEFRFNPQGALKGCDMLMKHKGLYELDNSQKNHAKEAIENMSPAAKKQLLQKLREHAKDDGPTMAGKPDAGRTSRTTH